MRYLLLEERRIPHPPNFIDRLNAVFIILTILLAIVTTVMVVASPSWGEQIDVLSLERAAVPSKTPLFMVQSSPDARYMRGYVGIDYDGMEWKLEKIESEGLDIDISYNKDTLSLYPAELAQTTSGYERGILDAASFVSESRYMELPDDITGRVKDLSREITGRFDTPFEKARAIEVFLKLNYDYDASFTPAPEDWEPNDWFLFESEEGICGNFASAFVVLARASDIPARMAVGYFVRAGVGDQFVYESQAHAWAEVGFENLGWIAFDAT